jgi:tetratricopeptide (TPR) repeat protein
MKKWTVTSLFSVLFPCILFCQIINIDAVGTTRAVVVGISDYQNEGIPDLKYADKDAEAFAKFLQSPAGGALDGNHLRVLLNEDATTAQMVSAFDWLIETVKEGDQVIIYFSGHGDVEQKTAFQLGFLLSWDSPPRSYAAGAFHLYYLQAIVSTLSTENKAKVVVITDACRSGNLAGNKVAGTQLTNANLAKQYANEIKILSCQADEYSIEGEQWGGGRGAFSYHLLEGLYGMADRNSDLQISLSEIDRYLEDNVTAEVAPHHQLPITIGNGREPIVNVNLDLLALIKEGKKGQIALFAQTESRGIEEVILTELDTSIKELYYAFQQSLNDKIFLAPIEACADTYYQELIREPKLEKLHNSIRRNYAAALQDDAQQVMNNWLIGEVNEISLSKVNQAAKYKLYPAYLARAANLLGEEHYMYPVLQSRKLYFEGYLMHIDNRNADSDLGKRILSKYQEALKWQPESPHVYNSMSSVYFYQMLQPDSSEHYAAKAIEIAPSWFIPYSELAFRYGVTTVIRNSNKARHFLEMADQVDSVAAQSNLWHINNWAVYYLRSNQSKKAELGFKKAIELDSTNATLFNNLGVVYLNRRKWQKAEKYFKIAIQLDSTNYLAHTNLAQIYWISGFQGNTKFRKNILQKAEASYNKALELDSTFLNALSGLARLYIMTSRFEEGKEFFLRAIKVDSMSIVTYMLMGDSYKKMKRPDDAEKTYLQLLKIDTLHSGALVGLSMVYISTGSYDKAEQRLLKELSLNPKNIMAIYQLGIVYHKTNRLDMAEKQFLEVLKLNPQFLVACTDLGLMYASLGRYEEAGQMLKKAEGFPPALSFTYLGYAVLNGHQNKLNEAFEYLEKAFIAGCKYDNPFVNISEDPGLVVLRAQKERWEALLEKYFPDDD